MNSLPPRQRVITCQAFNGPRPAPLKGFLPLKPVRCAAVCLRSFFLTLPSAADRAALVERRAKFEGRCSLPQTPTSN